MFYAYVIRSLVANYTYKGHCQNIEERLKQHNSEMTSSIKKYVPFELVYSEEFETRSEAMHRERYFKTAAGRKFLKSRLSLK